MMVVLFGGCDTRYNMIWCSVCMIQMKFGVWYSGVGTAARSRFDVWNAAERSHISYLEVMIRLWEFGIIRRSNASRWDCHYQTSLYCTPDITVSYTRHHCIIHLPFTLALYLWWLLHDARISGGRSSVSGVRDSTTMPVAKVQWDRGVLVHDTEYSGIWYSDHAKCVWYCTVMFDVWKGDVWCMM